MAQITQEQAPRWKSIVGVTTQAGGAAATSISLVNKDIMIKCVSGNLWINPLAVAVADATSYKMTVGETIRLNVETALSVIADGTAATYEYIILKNLWE